MRNKIFILVLIAIFLAANCRFEGGGVLAAEDAKDYQEKIDKLENKAEKVEEQLNTSQTMLQKTKSQIGTTQTLLQKTENEIQRTEKEIKSLEQRIELNKKMLGSYLQEMYFENQDAMVQLVLEEKNLSDLLSNAEQLTSVKERILATLSDIDQSKKDVEKAEVELSDKKDDHEQLLSVQKGQQYEIQTDIKEAQASLSELNAKINKLKSELSSLLGSAVSFKNVMDAASYSAKVTGIRKDYLLGVLVVESNLGRYTGGCNYKESRMSGTRAEIFKNICKELDYNYQKQKVSCPPSGYKGTGGAMGVAQFMPDTWVGYKSSIASVTGHNPPDPWSLTDGVVAMALKLAKVDGVKQHKESAEAKAYCIYLAGGNWAAYCDSKGVNYGEKVLYWADNYEKMMD